ncbi:MULTISPECIES: Mov34/MPN/PAD-1 family protein [Paenibacillus]|uniref:Uncharacterized protein n=2 Tax=Paenibacillus TaxID=44249 RepID=A0A1R0X389_9BACL|nr:MULTISPECIES: Mov34/MPN/PAD-1 family protein [Paenibacillus]ETT61200.1 hypothetical protein C171_13170 [Paenibacillus sp. FSL H8-237]MEC0134719.1 Mov34/MPN/PAD-1 family protein [Paenibacillus odorifer]MEC0221924.1 Mov34/MPN/PAD-1 family protein [Paenibacillus odorifer]OMD26482.1 hypothetical protein BJP48_22895 [Paenibacillus odorifer]OMD27689.1 hypothetical protein BJP51_24550 [Paenibacillus odorifer]
MLVHRYRDIEGNLEIEFSDDVLTFMLAQCTLSGELETGGILAGYYDDALNRAVIIKSSPAPIDSKQTRTRFYRGVQGLKDWLNTLWKLDKAYYVGEWHFHPFASSKMSLIDSKQMNSISNNKSMNCPEPILLIIGGNPRKRYSVSISIFMKNKKPIELNEYLPEII